MEGTNFDKHKLAQYCGNYINLYAKDAVEHKIPIERLIDAWKVIIPVSGTEEKAYINMSYWVCGYLDAVDRNEVKVEHGTVSFLDDIMRIEYSCPSLDDNYMNFSIYQMVGRLIAAKPWIAEYKDKRAEWVKLISLYNYQIITIYGKELEFIKWMHDEKKHDYPCKTKPEDSYYRFRFHKEVWGWPDGMCPEEAKEYERSQKHDN